MPCLSPVVAHVAGRGTHGVAGARLGLPKRVQALRCRLAWEFDQQA